MDFEVKGLMGGFVKYVVDDGWDWVSSIGGAGV